MPLFSIKLKSIYLFILLDISAHFPGDGCCIRWDRDGICCMNMEGQCCGDRGFGNDFDFRHHDGSRRGVYGKNNNFLICFRTDLMVVLVISEEIDRYVSKP